MESPFPSTLNKGEKKPDRFKAVILYYSDSNDFDEAMKEWDVLEYTEEQLENDNQCICTHKISNLYFVVHRVHNKQLIIGSSCIEQFGTSDQQDKADSLQKSHRRKTQDCLRCGGRFPKNTSKRLNCAQCEWDIAHTKNCLECQIEFVQRDRFDDSDKCPTCSNLVKCTECDQDFDQRKAPGSEICPDCNIIARTIFCTGHSGNYVCKTVKEATWMKKCPPCYAKWLNEQDKRECPTCHRYVVMQEWQNICGGCHNRTLNDRMNLHR